MAPAAVVTSVVVVGSAESEDGRQLRDLYAPCFRNATVAPLHLDSRLLPRLTLAAAPTESDNGLEKLPYRWERSSGDLLPRQVWRGANPAAPGRTEAAAQSSANRNRIIMMSALDIESAS
jgi:hypothetical protein